MHGKAITVLEMDHPIVEFLVLCETPYNNGERCDVTMGVGRGVEWGLILTIFSL